MGSNEGDEEGGWWEGLKELRKQAGGLGHSKKKLEMNWGK